MILHIGVNSSLFCIVDTLAARERGQAIMCRNAQSLVTPNSQSSIRRQDKRIPPRQDSKKKKKKALSGSYPPVMQA
jgi:hypothetical protein